MADNRNRDLIKGTLIYAIGTFGTKILNFLIVPLYTYFINPEELGTYDILVTTVSLISPLLTMKISEATYRWIIRNRENEKTYISATYSLLLRNCIIATFTILIIDHFYPIWNVYYFIAILVGDRILECLQKILRGLKNQKLFALSGVFHTAVFVLLNVIKICVLKEGVTALLQSSAISLYLSIILIIAVEKRIRVFDIGIDHSKYQKEMLRYSLPLVPTTLSWWIMSASDRYVIRIAIGAAANGIYSVSYKFPSVLQMLFTMFNNSWTDMALAQLDESSNTQFYAKILFERLYKMTFGLAFILIPSTKLVMYYILSQDYKEASVYMGFLYLGTVFQGLSSFCNIGYLQGKRTGGAAKTSFIGAVVNLIVDIFLIRYIGLHAAAISTFLGFFCMWLYRIHDTQHVFKIEVDKPKFVTYTLVGIIIAITTIWTTTYIDLIIIAVTSVCFCIFNKEMILKLARLLNLKSRNIVNKKKTDTEWLDK